jgi:hypothetical protein
MPASSLSYHERLILQNGALVKVSVTGEDQAGYLVSLVGKVQPWNQSKRNFGNVQRYKVPMHGATEPLGPELNQLKPGTPLNVTVRSVQNFGVFVTTNVYRKGRGGFWIPVDGFLKKIDIPRNMMVPSPNGYTMLYKEGDRITLYAKEIFKNSG